MASLDLGKTTTTEFDSGVTDITVTSETIDEQNRMGETFWDFPDASENLGIYNDRPEIHSGLRAFADWVCGKGYETATQNMNTTLSFIKGIGNENFLSIAMQLLINKKVFGDAFAQIIRNEKNTLINLKLLYTGNMRVVFDENGLIKRYEYKIGKKDFKKFKPEEILHVTENRMSGEVHGKSIVPVLKFILEAKKEALEDERKIRHRELALGILEVDTEDTTKLNQISKKVKDAVNEGEMLVLPKDAAQMKDNPNQPRDRIQWLQYLDSLFYQVLGIPKVIVTSEGFSEAGGKVGYLTFEPRYTTEQKLLEIEIKNQLGIELTFNRPPSLSNTMQEDEQKNTGQTGFQANESELNMQRSE